MKNFSIQVMPSRFSAEQREKGTSAFVEPLQMADTEWLQREVESMKLPASEGQTRVLVLSSAAILWTQTMFEEAVELPAGLYAVQGQPILLVHDRGTDIYYDDICFEVYLVSCC